MPYQVTIKQSAEKEMDRLPKSVFNRICDALLSLEEEPRSKGCKKLRGTDEYRLRVGEYRVLNQIDDAKEIVEIVSVGHRRDVYR
mgnify:CR=1 FL=1